MTDTTQIQRKRKAWGAVESVIFLLVSIVPGIAHADTLEGLETAVVGFLILIIYCPCLLAAIIRLSFPGAGDKKTLSSRRFVDFVLSSIAFVSFCYWLLYSQGRMSPDVVFIYIEILMFVSSLAVFLISIMRIVKNAESESGGEPDEEMLLRRARDYRMQKDHAKEHACFEEVLKINPGNVEACNYVSYELASKKEDLDRALQLATSAVAQRKTDSYILHTLGFVYLQRGDYQSALRHLLDSAALIEKQKPVGEPEVYMHLVEVYRFLEQPENVAKYAEKAEKATATRS